MTPNNTGANQETVGIAALDSTVAIIEAIRDLDGPRNIDIANATGLSKGSVHKHLATLRRHEFITEADGEYALSFRFLDLGEYVRRQHPGERYIRHALDKLAAETGELAYYITEEHGKAIIVFRRLGSESVKTQSREGVRQHLHQTAAGKLILANRPDEFVDRIIEQIGLPMATEHTITDPAALRAQLSDIAEQGYALNREESSTGLHAVSAPVFDNRNEIRGAVSVVGPKYRLSGTRFTEEIPDLLLMVANELELNLKHS